MYQKLDDVVRDLPLESWSTDQLKSRTSKLEMTVLFNRVCLFSAKRLREYQNSAYSIVPAILSILTLVLATTISFAAANFALFKIDPAFYEAKPDPNFFTFFYYSFNNLLFNSIREISPISAQAQVMSMLESFFALFLITIFVSLALSVRNQRASDELGAAIDSIEADGRHMEVFIKNEYRVSSIDDAMAELERLEAGLARLLSYITQGIK